MGSVLSPQQRNAISSFLAIFIVLTSGAQVRGQCQTTRVPSENTSTGGYFNGVAAISPTDAWAVGSFGISRGCCYRNLAEHWDGNSWTIVRTPDLGNPSPDDGLNSVSAEQASDVWAVGANYDVATQQLTPLAMHWNGVRWAMTAVSSPYPNTSLASVSAVKNTEVVWAVGNETLQNPGNPYIVRWQHHQWSVSFVYASPNAANLSAVSSPSLRSAWAVGQYTQSNGNTYPLVLRWDGSSWSQIDTTSLPPSSSFVSVSALSDQDVWAAGATGNQPLIAHWDGSTWTEVAPTPHALRYAVITGVSALARNSVWVNEIAFNLRRHDEDYNVLVGHWDGASWTMLRPPPELQETRLEGIAGLPFHVWSVGSTNHRDRTGISTYTVLSHC